MAQAPIATGSPASARPAERSIRWCCRAICRTCSRPGCRHRFDDAYYRTRTPDPRAHHGAVPLGRQLGRARACICAAMSSLTSRPRRSRNGSSCTTDTHFASMYLASRRSICASGSSRHFLSRVDGQRLRPGAKPVLLTVRDPRRLRPAHGERGVAARAHRMGDATRSTRPPCRSARTARRVPPRGALYDALRRGRATFRSAPLRAGQPSSPGHARRETVRVVLDGQRHGPLFVCRHARSTLTGTEVDVHGRERSAGIRRCTQGLAARPRGASSTRSARKPYRPFHPHDGEDKARVPSQVYGVDVAPGRPRSSHPKRATRAGADRPAAKRLRASRRDRHDERLRHPCTTAADRPAPEFAGINTIHTGGENASCLLLPLIRHG